MTLEHGGVSHLRKPVPGFSILRGKHLWRKANMHLLYRHRRLPYRLQGLGSHCDHCLDRSIKKRLHSTLPHTNNNCNTSTRRYSCFVSPLLFYSDYCVVMSFTFTGSLLQYFNSVVRTVWRTFCLLVLKKGNTTQVFMP